MKAIKSSKLFSLSILSLVALGFSINAYAATKIRMGWPTANSKSDPYAIAANYFKEELNKLAPDEFDVRFFPSNQLGDEDEMLQGMKMGSVDAGIVTATQISGLDKAFQVLDLPFLFDDSEHAYELLDGEAGQTLLQRLDKQGIVGLGFAEAGFRHTINNKKPIVKVDDFNGVKLRVQPSSIFLDSFKALGANPTPLAWSDTFTAVQQKTVDGLEIPLAVIYANKYAEEVKYLSLTKHTYNAVGLLFSKRMYDKLSDENKEHIKEAVKNTIDKQRETVSSNSQDILAQIEKAGMEVNEIDDIDNYRDKVQSIYDAYSKKIDSKIFELFTDK